MCDSVTSFKTSRFLKTDIQREAKASVKLGISREPLLLYILLESCGWCISDNTCDFYLASNWWKSRLEVWKSERETGDLGLSGAAGRVWTLLEILAIILPSISLAVFSYLLSISFTKYIKFSDERAVQNKYSCNICVTAAVHIRH